MGEVILFDSLRGGDLIGQDVGDLRSVIAQSFELEGHIGEARLFLQACTVSVERLTDGPMKARLRDHLEALRGQLLIASLQLARLIVIQRNMQRQQGTKPSALASI